MALCEFGNCPEDQELPVQVSIGKGELRKRFCCEGHAASWLLGEYVHRQASDGARGVVREVNQIVVERLNLNAIKPAS